MHTVCSFVFFDIYIKLQTPITDVQQVADSLSGDIGFIKEQNC